MGMRSHLWLSAILAWVDLLYLSDHNRGVGKVCQAINPVPLSIDISHLPRRLDTDGVGPIQGGSIGRNILHPATF